MVKTVDPPLANIQTMYCREWADDKTLSAGATYPLKPTGMGEGGESSQLRYHVLDVPAFRHCKVILNCEIEIKYLKYLSIGSQLNY